MEIPQISVFSPTRIGPLDPAAIRAGIMQRLALLTYLFCPEEEEKPDAVMARTRVAPVTDNELTIRWRPRMRYPMRIYRFASEELGEQREMAAFGLRWYPKADTRKPRDILKVAVDGVGFSPASTFKRSGMGWPLAIAAAAGLVDAAGGAIVTSSFGWFVPDGNEVRWLLKPLQDHGPADPAVSADRPRE